MLLSENKVWIQAVYKLPSYTGVTEYLKLKGDTLIDNFRYKKVFQSFDKDQKLWNKFGYIRETWDQKVYYRSDTSKQEYLFYDFSAQLNDIVKLTTIESVWINQYFREMTYTVSKIDSVLIDNTYLKKIQLDSYGYFDYCIEGIGSMSGLLYWDAGLVGGDNYDLICFWEDSVLKFHDDNYQDCYFEYHRASVEELNSTNQYIEIFSRDKGVMQIHTLKSSSGELKLFNTNGELILKQEIKSPETQICLPFNGLIVYQFISNKNETQTGKVIVK